MQVIGREGATLGRMESWGSGLVVGFALFVLTVLWTVVTGARTESLSVWWSLDAEVFTPWLHGLNALVWIVVPGLLWGLVYVNLQEKELL